jgi:hypothetical protein
MIFSAVALLLVPPLAWPQNGVVMSMQPRPWPDVPELTAKMARSSSRQGNLAMRIRDELGEVYADARFAGAFGVRGRPGISPGQLMMASVLQFSEDLTDRQAAEAVRDRMTWKYALGLELEDPVALYGSLGVSGGEGGWLWPPPGGGGGLWPVLPGLFAVTGAAAGCRRRPGG